MKINIETDYTTNNMSKIIYNSLKKQILDLELLPGTKMSEIKVANSTGCSRTPVRDAFHQLRVEGFLESRPQVGTFVPKIDMHKAEEVRFVRESIEIAVIKYGMKNNMFDQYLPELRERVRIQEKVYSEKDYSAFNELDMAFHGRFREITGRECSDLYCGNEDINYARLRFMSVRYEKNWHIAIDHHNAILDAIEKHDIEAMEEAVSAHINNLYVVLESSDLNNSQILNRNISKGII